MKVQIMNLKEYEQIKEYIPHKKNLLYLSLIHILQRKYGFKDWDSVLAAIGHGGLKEGQVVNRLAEEYLSLIHI